MTSNTLEKQTMTPHRDLTVTTVIHPSNGSRHARRRVGGNKRDAQV